jgi:cephalosporin hydroxylase
MKKLLKSAYARFVAPAIHRRCLADMMAASADFSSVRWEGRVLWQNPLDLWRIHESVLELRPRLIVETGTNEGGTALYLAHLLDQIGHGRILTMDIKEVDGLDHPRVRFIRGRSIDGEAVETARAEAAGRSPVLVLLDSDHSAAYVREEMDRYAPLVTPGSWLLVQNGVIDQLPHLRGTRPGPLPAIRDFLRDHPDFEVDHERCGRYLLTHHPMGWLRRAQTVAATSSRERKMGSPRRFE